MKYTFNDMKDKSTEGIKKEMMEGLVKIAVFMETSMGFPHEIFIDKIESMSFAQQLIFYLSYRNRKPKIFK